MFIIKKYKKSFVFFGIFVFLLGLYVALSPFKIDTSKAIDVWEDLGGGSRYI